MKAVLTLLALLTCFLFAVATDDGDPVVHEPSSHSNRELTAVTFQTTEPSTIQIRTLIMKRSEMPPSPHPCTDEYCNNRTEEFNLVDPSRVRNRLRSFSPPGQYQCVHPSEPRVLLRDQHFSSAFQTTLRVKDWCLYNGCMVQSFTVPYRATLTTNCSSSLECIVIVPCVAPKIAIRYEYEFCAEGGNSTGTVDWRFVTEPFEIRVKISKNAHRLCEILKTVEENHGPKKWWVCIDKQDYPDQKRLFNVFLNGSPALRNFIADEIKLFAIRVVREAFSQSNNVFSPIEDLHRFCDRLVAPGESVEPDDMPSPSVNDTRSSSTEGENHQTSRLTTDIKSDTDSINITVNVNINMPPPPALPLNKETFLQFLQFLNYTQLSNPSSLEPTNENFTVSH